MMNIVFDMLRKHIENLDSHQQIEIRSLVDVATNDAMLNYGIKEVLIALMIKVGRCRNRN